MKILTNLENKLKALQSRFGQLDADFAKAEIDRTIQLDGWKDGQESGLKTTTEDGTFRIIN